MKIENPLVQSPTLAAAPPAAEGKRAPQTKETEPQPQALLKVPVDQTKAENVAYEKRLELAQRLLGSDKSLIIERGSGNYGFVYKTVNRETGEVLRVWPKQDALKTLQARTDCAACDAVTGAMVDARV
jgi:hypothetical protein